MDAEQVGRDLDGAGVDRAVIVQAVGPYGTTTATPGRRCAADPDRFALRRRDRRGRRRSRRRARRPGRRGTGRRACGCSRRPATRPGSTDGRGRGDLGRRRRHRDRRSSPRCSPTTSTRSPSSSRAGPTWPSRSTTGVPRSHRRPAVRERRPALRARRAAGGPPEGDDHLAAGGAATRADRARWSSASSSGSAPTGSCWGSDHPQSFELPYPEMVAAGARRVSRASTPADRDAVLGGTAGPAVVRRPLMGARCRSRPGAGRSRPRPLVADEPGPTASRSPRSPPGWACAASRSTRTSTGSTGCGATWRCSGSDLARRRLVRRSMGRSGRDALRALAAAYAGFAAERPGLYACARGAPPGDEPR